MSTVATVSGALTALRAQVKGQTFASTDSKNRAAAAVDRFQAEVAALGVATATGIDSGSATSLGDALGAMRQQLAAQTALAAYARATALARFDQLIAELASIGLAVGS